MQESEKPMMCKNCKTERRPVYKTGYCRKCHGWARSLYAEIRKGEPNHRRIQTFSRQLAILEERERGLRVGEEVDALQLESALYTIAANCRSELTPGGLHTALHQMTPKDRKIIHYYLIEIIENIPQTKPRPFVIRPPRKGKYQWDHPAYTIGDSG
jgi:hypothetical protein